MSNFYVYEWIRLDTNEPFYVGKGKEDRAYSLKSRNKHFNDVVTYCNKNSIDIAVYVIKDSLTEEEALQYECWYINEYIVEYGFNLTNKTWGGDGGNSYSLLSYEDQQAYSLKMRNSCLGKNKGHSHSAETRKLLSDLAKEKTGEKNPFYGKHHSKESLEKISKGVSEALTGHVHSEETKRKIGVGNRGKLKKGMFSDRVYSCTCTMCGDSYEAKSPSKYCSKACRNARLREKYHEDRGESK